MPPIQQDGANTNTSVTFETEDDATNAFLNLFADKTDDDASKKKPSDKGEESNAAEKEDDANSADADDEQPTDDETEGDNEDDESPSEDAEGDDEEGEDDDKTKDEKKYADSDDIYVKVKVGDEEHEVPVKDLKRLFGQEAALTRKSQEVATKTKEVEAAQAKNIAALDVLVKRAQEAANPYRNINWAALMKDPNVSAEEANALQQAARVAFENETFLTSQLDAFMGEVQKQQQAVHAKAAQDCLKALTTEDSPTYIKGWDQNLYNDLRAFAVEMGMHKDAVNNLTEAPAFKLLHMAMQFHRGSKKVVTTKVNKAPKKIVKSSTAQGNVNRSVTSKQIDRKQKVAQLKKTGSMDDAVAAFETMFSGD
jgi:hypothetical protein